MAARRFYTVNSSCGLNVRESPSFEAAILRVLPDGEQVTVDGTRKPPREWVAVEGGGYVCKDYLK